MSCQLKLWLVVATITLVVADPTSAAPKASASLQDASVLGLQRGLQVQKKAAPLEEEDEHHTDAESWLKTTTIGLQRGFTISKKTTGTSAKAVDAAAAVADEVVAKGLAADDAGKPTWLDTSALGLQRGFVVKKKAKAPAETMKKTTAAGAPNWLETTALGLQRGFVVTKKAPAAAEPSTALGQSGTVLGLQRGIALKKVKALSEDEEEEENTGFGFIV